ncbi:MAG TPA: hypothetical protein VG055_12725 [Planctomycetaceae bacterium]|jgi:hypothetical protein|nr:hypothetical protein [Planctomycetaceae bacterium]
MRFVAPIVLALAFAIGGDVGLYAYSVREHPQERYRNFCWPASMGEKRRREEQAQSERDMLVVSALFVNVAALACIYGTLRRLRRDRDRIAGDGMTA